MLRFDWKKKLVYLFSFFLFLGVVGINGRETDGITGGFTIKTKKSKVSKGNGKLLQAYLTKAADNILSKRRVFQHWESYPDLFCFITIRYVSKRITGQFTFVH